MSPTVLRLGPYRFFFFSNEGTEPPHVHVQREDHLAKFSLAPVSLLISSGFDPRECRKIERLVVAHAGELLEAWNDYFSG